MGVAAAAAQGRSIHAYHCEGAGGGHAPDIIAVCGRPEASTLSLSHTQSMPVCPSAAPRRVRAAPFARPSVAASSRLPPRQPPRTLSGATLMTEREISFEAERSGGEVGRSSSLPQGSELRRRRRLIRDDASCLVCLACALPFFIWGLVGWRARACARVVVCAECARCVCVCACVCAGAARVDEPDDAAHCQHPRRAPRHAHGGLYIYIYIYMSCDAATRHLDMLWEVQGKWDKRKARAWRG
jgi:hypothetical protein